MERQTHVPWQPEDIGRPIPDLPHACSVALPTWQSVVGYEEGDPEVLAKLNCGYPRFLLHAKVRELFAEAKAELADDSETVVVFPRATVVQRAQRFIEQRTKVATRVTSFRGLQALILPQSQEPLALQYWRYTGEVVTSRQATAALASEDVSVDRAAEQAVRDALATSRSVDPGDVYLFENGMAAIFAVHRAVTHLSPGKKTLQLEFPYVDALRVQQNFGAGVAFLNTSEGDDHAECLSRIRAGEFAAVFVEMPSNPLLRCANLPELADACRTGNTILVVDDTVASHLNVDVAPYADIITTSLTKWISGRGDVMAGSAVINPASIAYNDLASFFTEATGTGRLFTADAEHLLENMKGFEARMTTVNSNGLAIYEYLVEHPMISEVWYPKCTTPYRYEDIKRPSGGYGGLISFTLKSASRAQKFYDALPLSKGPSLGTDFTLVCPYTMLAHYDELSWAKDCGVPAALLRISVGCEPIDSIKSALDDAFSAL